MSLFKNKKPKTNTINLDKELNLLKKEQLLECEKNGKSMASNNTTIDNKTVLDNLPAVVQTKGTFQAKENSIGVIYDKDLSDFKTTYDLHVNDFEKSKEYSSIHSDIKSLLDEQEKVIGEAETSHDEDMTDKKDRIESLKTEITNKKTDLDGCKRHNTRTQNIFASIIILLIWVGEIVLNKDAFSYIGLIERDALFVGLAISVMTLMLGIAQSSVLRKENFNFVKKILFSLMLITTVCLVYFTLGSIRVSLMESQSENDGIFGLSAIYFVFLNLSLYIAIFSAKYFLFSTPQQAKDNAEFNLAKNELNKCIKEDKKLKSDLKDSAKTKLKVVNGIKKDFSTRLNPLIKKVDTKIEAIKNSALAYNKELSYAINFFEQINADYFSCIGCLIFNYNSFSSEKIETILIEKLEPLKNPFENLEPISIEKIEELKTTPTQTDEEE
jgi:hypothetical protein